MLTFKLIKSVTIRFFLMMQGSVPKIFELNYFKNEGKDIF